MCEFRLGKDAAEEREGLRREKGKGESVCVWRVLKRQGSKEQIGMGL